MGDVVYDGVMETVAMTKKRGRGRPAKAKRDKQAMRIIAYVTPGDAKQIRADAAELGVTPSAFMTDLWRQWRMSREA